MVSQYVQLCRHIAHGLLILVSTSYITWLYTLLERVPEKQRPGCLAWDLDHYAHRILKSHNNAVRLYNALQFSEPFHMPVPYLIPATL